MYYTQRMQWPPVLVFLTLTAVLYEPALADRLSLTVVLKAGKNLWILRPGGTVRDGDRLAMRVEADQSTYLYVVHSDRDGQRLLHPIDKPDRLAQAEPRRIPADHERWLVMEGMQSAQARQEDLIIIASPAPMANAAILSRAKAALTESSPPNSTESSRSRVALTKEAVTQPPPGILTDPGYRSLMLSHDSHAPLSQGRAVLRFSFWHR